MSAIVVSWTDLSRALAVVKPHVGRDASLTLLTCATFKTINGHLYLCGTDRYTVGMVAVNAAEAAPDIEWPVLATDLARAVALFKPARGLPMPELSITLHESILTIEETADSGFAPGMRFAARQPEVQIPPYATLLTDMLAKMTPDRTPATHARLNPVLLARFGVLGREQSIVMRQVAPDKGNRANPVVVAALDFIGAIMPMAPHEDDLSSVDVWKKALS